MTCILEQGFNTHEVSYVIKGYILNCVSEADLGGCLLDLVECATGVPVASDLRCLGGRWTTGLLKNAVCTRAPPSRGNLEHILRAESN